MLAARTRDAGRPALDELMALGVTQDHIEQYRIDRLLELRAVIDSLRAERARPDLDRIHRQGL